ncbi:MAG TPA: TetR family transcriptional regulator [Actinophytocola sp.]|uniref:TetR/AcrR family transcriptional regulator n=1 Tax=Actinophytocola sp. TaxID=1872138 RepID=UPI002F9200F4
MFGAEDLTARAVIRDRALALFAEHGPDAVTVRQIAAAAGVSPALVVHHYGSKQGLREVVDEHVAGLFDAMLSSVTEDPAPLAEGGPRAVSSFAELLRAHLPEGSAVPAYLRRLLLSGDVAGRALFRRVFDMSTVMVDQLVAAGIMRPTADPAVRAAFLMINDLAVVLLRDHLADVLGVDPLGEDGLRRWATDVLSAYTEGVFHGEER